MQKTKLGISVGLLGATINFMGLFSGYVAMVLLTGYILLCEDNEWLKKSAVKAVAVMVLFSILFTVINFIPDAIDTIDYLFSMFGGDFQIAFLYNLFHAFNSALYIIEGLVFLCLGVKAFNQGTISVPIVDYLINKYME